MKRRVVVTGLGVCSPVGTGIERTWESLVAGRSGIAVAGSSESTISPYAIDGYCQLRALSTRNDEPERASRPFDADRDGFVIAEGAGVLRRVQRLRFRRTQCRVGLPLGPRIAESCRPTGSR